jgi:iron(III) transport system permease protein
VIGKSERYATISGNTYQRRQVRLGAWKYPAAALALGYVLIAFVLPMLVVFWTSLQPFYTPPSFEALDRASFRAFERVLGSTDFQRAVVNTVIVGGATAFSAMTLALLISWVLVRSRSRWRAALDVLAFTPHAMPGVIIGLSILLIYLLLPVPVVGTIWIIVIALATQWITLATRLMTGAVVQVNNQLEEAAWVSGAGWATTIRRVVLPLVAPAFWNGVLLLFLFAVKVLTIPLILSTPQNTMLSTLIWRRWDAADTGDAAAIGILMVLVTLTLSLVVRRAGTSQRV